MGVSLVEAPLRRLYRIVAFAARFLHHHRLDKLHIFGDSVLLRILLYQRRVGFHLRTDRGIGCAVAFAVAFAVCAAFWAALADTFAVFCAVFAVCSVVLIAVLDVAFAVFTPFSVALTVPLSAVFMVFSAFLTVVLIVRFPCCLVFINEFAAVWGVSVRKTRQRKLPLSMPARYLTIRAGYLSACLPSPH